jgi:squalene/oxidosqualene cyclase-like protein
MARNQRLTNVPDADRYFRHPSRGGWSLSTGEQGWILTDGTAEALLGLLDASELGLAEEFTPDRVLASVELLLSLQNPDGGWPVFEKLRAPRWMAKLNFADILDELLLDASTLEPTTSCVVALRRFRDRNPLTLRQTIDHAVAAGQEHLLYRQRPDGSWEGMWGICFTYGTWFGIRGLTGSTDPRAASAIDRACEFLLAHQREDGGWGETIDGYRARRYIHADTSQATMTAWALLALVDAGRADCPAASRAIDFLLRTQLADGGWQDEHEAGCFMRTTAMNYDGYQRNFPVWALSAVADSRRRSGRAMTDDPPPTQPAKDRGSA